MYSEPVTVVKENLDRTMPHLDAVRRSLSSPWRGFFHNNDQLTVHYPAYYMATYLSLISSLFNLYKNQTLNTTSCGLINSGVLHVTISGTMIS